jgi:hypothetical protein
MNVLQRLVYGYIKRNPGRTASEIAEHWDHSQKAYEAIAFLWLGLYTETDLSTSTITARAA